jgi:hypothetical protein
MVTALGYVDDLDGLRDSRASRLNIRSPDAGHNVGTGSLWPARIIACAQKKCLDRLHGRGIGIGLMLSDHVRQRQA